VKKAVMVLIDSGSSMADIIPSTRSDSNLATAFRATESFLDTTTKDDYVNIFTFDQAKVEPFSPQPVSHIILKILCAKFFFYYTKNASLVQVKPGAKKHEFYGI